MIVRKTTTSISNGMEPNQTKTTFKDIFLNLGIIVSLYTIVYNLINLLFTVINKAYPQINNYGGYYYSQTYSISWPVAALIVFFPIFIILSWILGKEFAVNPEKKNLGVHKGLIYITLFLAGIAFAGDLVTIIYYYIDGQELTTAFLLKALVVLVISGLIFYYYITEIRRAMSASERMAWRFVAGIIILGSIIWGFSVLGSPRTQRLLKYDGQKINDLQNVSSQVQNYYSMKGSLPESLSDLSNLAGYYNIPVDKQTSQSYEYNKTGATSYEVCATFNKESVDQKSIDQNSFGYPSIAIYRGGESFYKHPAGRHCFTQIVIPNQNQFPVQKPIY